MGLTVRRRPAFFEPRAEASLILDEIVQRLKQSEGWRSHVYIDTTGNLTIGYGLNLGKLVLPDGVRFQDVRIAVVNGIPQDLAEQLLVDELTRTIAELRQLAPWIDGLDETRQQVLADMSFNMGVPKLVNGWPNFLGNVKAGRFSAAAAIMRSSKWATQVKGRAVRLAEMMETGQRGEA